MSVWDHRRSALAIGVGLTLVGSAVALLTDRTEPEFDHDLWHSIRPVVHADLPTNPKVTWTVPPGGRWFCAEHAVETTRQESGDVRVGLIATCRSFVRRDDALVSSSGISAALVVALMSGPGGYRVRDVEVPLDGAGNDASLRQMFTEAGYDVVQRSMRETRPDPAPEARTAFGLPADAPVLPR